MLLGLRRLRSLVMQGLPWVTVDVVSTLVSALPNLAFIDVYKV